MGRVLLNKILERYLSSTKYKQNPSYSLENMSSYTLTLKISKSMTLTLR